MKNGARWLFILACALAFAAVVQDFRFDSSSRQNQSRARSVEREVGDLRSRLADLRRGQTAYLATGQGPEFWTQRVSEQFAALESGVGQLRNSVKTADAQAQVTSAVSALEALGAIDKRAREALDSEQRFLASDIVFAEGQAPAQALVDAVSAAGVAEISAIDARAVRDARIRLAMTAAALLVVIIAGVVVMQAPRPQSPASAAATMAQMLRELPPPVKTPVVTQPAAAPPKPVAPPVPAVDLTEAAELCVDLARVMDARDIPTLLGRSAKTLDASGIVVWVVTTEGDKLVPALSHGYSTKIVAKLGSLDVANDNITSVCFRTMKPQSMTGIGQPGATSAIAVPLITTDGCNGVMAAELQVIKPAADSIAVARIIAAQFASMIRPESLGTMSGDVQAAEG